MVLNRLFRGKLTVKRQRFGASGVGSIALDRPSAIETGDGDDALARRLPSKGDEWLLRFIHNHAMNRRFQNRS
ncbi:hypothetical protein MFFC18_31600 [Mariniblastus fucicola]|uniref:Uncharacterized protein n=1 Tax=Mariniblastus fucicola TaxID=980251 RepID=A0A5B9PAG7_9BACT|nr:hypothetical protein MFFC18_31600 [Mariniblastus fucicola]